MPTGYITPPVEGPTEQRGLFGDPLPDSSPQLDNLTCAGGCGSLSPDPMRLTPEGFMCARCIDDLYTECEDCDTWLRYDDWGECDNLRVGPDDRRRCLRCDRTAFILCNHCGRRTVRSDANVYTNPNNLTEEYCHSCWQGLWFTCASCNDVFHRRDAFNAPRNSNLHCEDCFEQYYFRCAGCNGSFDSSEMCGWSGDPFCNTCYGSADVWKPWPWSGRASKFDRVGSRRCYGVELETERCDNHRELHGKTEWGCVYECSTPGREFVSPILQGDEGFDEVKKMCDIAELHRWTIDRSCGLHVHVDVRDLSSDEMLQVVYAYRKSYPLWRKFVSRRRASNSMCGSPQYNANDVRGVEHIEDFVETRDRFEFVNWRSYLRHGSIEVRLYRGSLQTREICAWVALHTRFVDAVKDLTFDEIDDRIGSITRKNWRGLVELIGDPKLLDYWRRIAKRHGNILPALWIGEDDSMVVDDSESESEWVSSQEAREDDACREGDNYPGNYPDDRQPSWDARQGPVVQRGRVFNPRTQRIEDVEDSSEVHCGDTNCRECNEQYGRLESDCSINVSLS